MSDGRLGGSRGAGEDEGESAGNGAAGAPGKRTLTQRTVARASRPADGGAALPAPVQARFESSIGTSLADVRLHTGDESAAAASSLGARAFTVGNDIHFNRDQYRTDDPFGMHLLAHEVAHTVQQGGAPAGVQAKLEVSAPGDSLELEADAAADAMVRGEPAQVGRGARLIARAPDGSGGGRPAAAANSGDGGAAGADDRAADGAGTGDDDATAGGGEWDLALAQTMAGDGDGSGGAGVGPGGAAGDAAKQVQRTARGGAGGDHVSAEEAVAVAGGGGGQAPDDHVRRKVAAVTGADLRGARVHTGTASHRAADALGAHAYAVDQDIHFAEGQYRPGTRDGDRLLAHELVHTAQQSRGAGGLLQPKLAISQPGDAAEIEADRIADLVVGGSPGDTHVAVAESASGIHLHPADSVVRAVAKRALKWLAKRGANVSAHIAKRHIARRLGKSTFTNGGKMVKRWVQETVSNPGNVVDQGRRLVFEKAFGHPVGKGGERIVRVVVDKVTGKIVTAFPTQAFKTLVVAAVATAATVKAGEADAAILQRRAAIQKALEPSVLDTIIDVIIGTSSVARDEDMLAEERIIDKKIAEAIDAAEQELQRCLSPEEREAVREQIMLEMQTEPSAGVIE